ncbi:hypothetical protein HRR83_005193 [Exophiala dermatitidis]|uniref:Uncharacterized protein n=1 Tax=Exophiala dermatitidis TaxID=5970 RepID=A0AAN6EX57_EXODE|nr:hypothetical protein HRR75_004621 [Exophiala dermatitidis]KAJ4515888.1 hypothetical protein HRR74_005045 [Exophiala dermatitidis]KAJ4518705.1 hypothetical protein HRR73_004286 [Exophiala dermatitidis]KAJ4534218.1 hypothetical protein HRR76_006152 [Exophiala dermatitidis]KAJ4545885.1 hypothetical protein HRR78_005724 [Exophiala dermatitidis]
MTKRDRSYPNPEVSNQTTESLYELGLLNRPRTRSRSSTAESKAAHYQHPRGRHDGYPPRASSSLSGAAPNPSFKQSSISSGTLLGRPHTPNEGRPRTRDQRLPPSPTASVPGAGHPMAGMLDTDRARSRRERTFVGVECAACEEPLEHTLRGERVLQFSCGHVAHEACFYEYIREADSQYCPTCDAPLGLDSFRGGSILDLSKLSNMVRAVAQKDITSPRSTQTTPMPWDKQEDSYSSRDVPQRHSRDNSNRDSRDSQRLRIERLGIGQAQSQPATSTKHARTDSGGNASSDYTHDHGSQPPRKHDYDLHAMETSVPGAAIKDTKQSIPAPIVTVRSEYPTLTRSQQQQSLTCLVTIEVPEGKWQQHLDEVHNTPPVPPLPTDSGIGMPPRHRHEPPQELDVYESPEVLEQITEELQMRVDNWHGLEFQRFGNLRLHGVIRVGKDRHSWQELECYLFGEMLICVKEKKNAPPIITDSGRKLTRCTLKGSILIRKHLRQVHASPDENILTLNLSVAELPTFHLLFQDREKLHLWQRALRNLHSSDSSLRYPEYEQDTSGTDEEEYSRQQRSVRRVPSITSSYGGPKSATTAATEYSMHKAPLDTRVPSSLHIPVDVVVVIPVSSSMQGLKIKLLRDTLRFLVSNLGERDRMGLVTFGSSGGGVPLVGMTTKTWSGWNKVLSSIRPVGQKSLRADVVEGANVAMDLLMQRRAANPISTILLISDSSTSESDSVDFVVQRAEAAKVGIYSFGLGLTHKPESMIELSSRTKASYLYVKDWMMLRECAAGVLGALQSISHQNVKLKLKLPEGSPAKFVKINGALQTTKRASGRDAEATLGDLRFGDKRDILVQLAIDPDTTTQEAAPQDPWESIVSGLEALGGSLDNDDQRPQSVEELPLIQADLSFGDLLREGSITQLARPSLLTITMLPQSQRSRQNGRPPTPPIPPHPSIVQRRMELLTSDMLSRALTLVARGQHERAHHLLNETRTILKGLGKGGLPPLPPGASHLPINKRHTPPGKSASPRAGSPEQTRDRSPHSETSTPIPRTTGVDHTVMNALDADIEASLEWINHPAVFTRDARKAVLQAIGVISSQRAYTFRTASESIWAERIPGVKRLTELAREWREAADDALTEE